MKKSVLILPLLFWPLLAQAQNQETLIFEDDFERQESDDTKEEIGKGWSSNSLKRAKGNKQVDLKDGAMHITFHPVADHAVSVVHPAEFQDGKVTLRFMLPTEKDSLGLNFADLSYKKVHAGHLCMAKISTKEIQINDLKTGIMDLETRTARLNGTISPEKVKMLRTKTKKFTNPLSPGKWHSLEIIIRAKTMSVAIDQKTIGSFSSEGIAHPTKKTLRVAVPKQAIIDDLKVYSIP